jgi:hypothetical protein
MAPGASGQDLLYVGGHDGNSVEVLSYPNLQLVGHLKVRATGLCSDSSGNVFVTTFPRGGPGGAIAEYAHGGTKPIATLQDGYRPTGCAVDPGTGDLAVTDLGTVSGRQMNVAIFRHAKGNPVFWTDPSFFWYLFCGYDNHGNLFVDGTTAGNAFEFAELPKGGTLQNVSLNQTIQYPGSVQWDGNYVAVADTKAHAIYRFTISGYNGTLEGTTALSGWETRQNAQTWISGGTVAAAYGVADQRAIGVWNYPAGGSPTQTASGVLKNGWVLSLTVSLAPSRRHAP